jgi:hypothetical protein
MSKIIRLKKCEGWCKKRHIPDGYYQNRHTITNTQCMCSQMWLVNKDYITSSFKLCCEYPKVRGKN